MDAFERFQEGYYAGFPDVGASAPLWARELHWDGMGMWIVVQPADLIKVIKGLEFFPEPTGPCTILLESPPSNAYLLRQFFERIEDSGLSVVATTPNQFLSCMGANLVRNEAGGSELVGIYELEAHASPDVPKLIYPIRGRLRLCQAPGSVSLPPGVLGISYFKVKCLVTMFSLDARRLHEEPDSGAQPATARRSFMRPVFLTHKTSAPGALVQEVTVRQPQSPISRTSWAEPFISATARRLSRTSSSKKVDRGPATSDDDIL